MHYTQHLALVFNTVSLAAGLVIVRWVSDLRPFGWSVFLYGLVGSVYYFAVLGLGIPGHNLSIYRSIFQAAIWAFYPIGLLASWIRGRNAG